MAAKINDPFIPPFYLRNPMLQTVLASSGLRKLGRNVMAESASEQIIDAGRDVRLQGWHSINAGRESKGLVVLIHGCEGSSHSADILSMGKVLFHAGYDDFGEAMSSNGYWEMTEIL